ncbi:MAG: hypothetical protein J6D27_04765 [Ruminiclostridium sp.]|nr:hypothetical protein [Ruminiclostridium sp.]
MKIGKYQVKLNYGILKGFIDVMGLLLAYLIYQTTFAFVNNMTNPSSAVLKRIVETIFADGIPFHVWLWGFTFPIIALAVIVFSIWFMFAKHKEPKRFVITEANAQKYYDTIMITNSLLRILALFALWDLTFICQNNILLQGTSWFSLQFVLDVIVAGLVIYITYCRIKAFAKIRTEKDKASSEKPSVREEGKVKIKKKENSDEDVIMRG